MTNAVGVPHASPICAQPEDHAAGIQASRPAGFWVRFAAFWQDAVLVGAGVTAFVWLGGACGVALSPELTTLVVGALYWISLTGWRGQTVGKGVCGLTVIGKDGLAPALPRVIARESVGKVLSALPLFLGFLWVGPWRSKRGWHDWIAGTRVVQEPAKALRARVLLGLSLVVSLGMPFFSRSANPIRLLAEFRAARRMAVDSNSIVTTYSRRDPVSLVELNPLASADLSPFVAWLDRNSDDPVEYAVETAARHEITLFGEMHWVHDNLAFFNRLIPELHRRAGVTCIALECCIPEENARLVRLVTAAEFDRALALDIARSGDLWKNWGWKGYWDILETVWRLNRSLPPDARKLRVVGIGVELDGPSMAMVGIGGVPVPGPPWNKLRVFTLLDDLIRVAMTDHLYAANVARETIEKGERGVVLVGGAHTCLRQLWPHGQGARLIQERARMGFMLHERYGDRVFQIVLHNGLASGDTVMQFIERVASQRQDQPFGCDIAGSPFAKLRDSGSGQWPLQPGLCFSDLAAGYIFLGPTAEQQRCEWVEWYISPQMFAKHRRYYEAKLGRALNDHEEANAAFRDYTGW